MKKSKSFVTAAWLYLTGMLVGLVYPFFFDYVTNDDHAVVSWLPITTAAIFIATVFFSYLISKGLDWVRKTSVVLAILSFGIILTNPSSFFQNLSYNFLNGVLIVISFLLRGLSIYFQFNKDSNEYIRSKKLN